MALSHTPARPVTRPAPWEQSLNRRQKSKAPAALSKPLVEEVRQLAEVQPMPGYYLVKLAGESAPRHLIRKDKTCTCERGAACPAVEAVTAYLLAGGKRAADVPAHCLIPAACPICGGAVKFEPRLSSPVRGAGWVCVEAARQYTSDLPEALRLPGAAHYWQAAWETVRPFLQRGVAQ